jgi:hypothetical protein
MPPDVERNDGYEITTSDSDSISAGDCFLKHGLSLFMNRASRYFARSPQQAAATNLQSVPGFARAMLQQFSMASFRPRRWPATPVPFEFSSPRTGRGQ